MKRLAYFLALVVTIFATSAYSQVPTPRVTISGPFGPNDYPAFGGDYARQYVENQANSLASAQPTPIVWIQGDVIRLNYADGSWQLFTVNVQAGGAVTVSATSGVFINANAPGGGGACTTTYSRLDGISGYWVTAWSCVNGSCGSTGYEFIRTLGADNTYQETPSCA